MSKKPYNPNTIYDRIKKARKHTGFVSDAKLAAALGIKQGTITKWKQGTIPGADMLIAICNKCDCDIDFLLGRIDTYHIENHSIQEETGLSEEAIEALKEESSRNGDIKDLLQIKSIKTKLINGFILECDPISKGLQEIESSENLLSYCGDIGIDLETLKKIFMSTQESSNTPSDNLLSFKEAMLKDYPSIAESAIFDLYMNLSTAGATRFNIDQYFNRFIDAFLRRERDTRERLANEPIGGETAKDK